MKQVKLSAAAKEKVASWLNILQEGDCIKVQKFGVAMYNESGCELDYVAANSK